MSNCTHNHREDIHLFPTTFTHDEHDHNCGCVKCYLNDIVNTVKIDFVWLIEYHLLFIFFNSISHELKSYNLSNSFSPRSPPKHK